MFFRSSSLVDLDLKENYRLRSLWMEGTSRCTDQLELIQTAVDFPSFIVRPLLHDALILNRSAFTVKVSRPAVTRSPRSTFRFHLIKNVTDLQHFYAPLLGIISWKLKLSLALLMEVDRSLMSRCQWLVLVFLSSLSFFYGSCLFCFCVFSVLHECKSGALSLIATVSAENFPINRAHLGRFRAE